MLENDAPKKTTKNLSLKCRQKHRFCVQIWWVFRGGNVPKIINIHKFRKMEPRDVPDSKRHPKSVQKASKRCPKSVQKASKLDPTGIKITKPQCKELQRTIRASHLNKNLSTCKADLSSHLDCSRLSQCCFLTCKPLACPRSMSMQVYRYSSQKTTEQPKYNDLQRPAKNPAPHQILPNAE